MKVQPNDEGLIMEPGISKQISKQKRRSQTSLPNQWLDSLAGASIDAMKVSSQWQAYSVLSLSTDGGEPLELELPGLIGLSSTSSH
jgi:hypothetical protein